MKKIITIASALALTGSMALAMEEGEAMDEMMEAPAPSVTLSGAAELGFKNVDDSSKPDAESIKLIRKYQVNFGSSGTTDGGLAFGAGISIEDEQGIDDHTRRVNGSNVYIGAADGSWKLKLGGNDPGIDVAGGFGVADDHFDGEGDSTVGLEGAFGETSFRITMADPNSIHDGDWSAGAKHSLNNIRVGVGMDSEDGLAISLGTDLSGVGVDVYWSQSEDSQSSLDDFEAGLKGDYDAARIGTSQLTGYVDGSTPLIKYNSGRTLPAASRFMTDSSMSDKNTGIGVKASMSAGEGAKFTAAYSKLDWGTSTVKGWYGTADRADGAASNVTEMWSKEATLISIGFDYDLGGGAMFKASVEKKDTETAGSVTAPDNTYSITADDTDGDDDTDPDVRSLNDTTDVTTLKAVLAFTF